MKRLLRRNKRHCDEHRIPEHARTLHVDTAFTDKGFSDMERLDKGDDMFNTVPVDSFKSWRIESSEEWATKDDVRINPLKHANMEEVIDSAEVTNKWEKKSVAFKDTRLIDSNSEEPEIMVRDYANIAVKSDDEYEMAKNEARIDTNHPRTKTVCWTEDISENIANGHGPYSRQTKARLAKSLSTPDWSFSVPVSSKSNEGRKHDKSKWKISGQMPNQPYIQKIGGQMSKSISLPNVIDSSNFVNNSRYDRIYDDTSSVSDGDANDSILSDLDITAATNSITGEQQKGDICSGSDSMNGEIANFQDSKKVKIEVAHKSLPEMQQNNEHSRNKETEITSTLAEKVKPNEDEQQYEEEENVCRDEEFQNSLKENTTANEEENQRDKILKVDAEVDKYNREEANNEFTSTEDANEKVQQYHDSVKVNIDVEFDKTIREETDTECKLIEDLTARDEGQQCQEGSAVDEEAELENDSQAETIIENKLIEDVAGYEGEQQYLEDARVNEEAELESDSQAKAIIESEVKEDVTGREEGEQHYEDAKATPNEELSKNGFDPGKWKISEKECDSSGKESTDVGSTTCLTKTEENMENDNEMDTDGSEYTGRELMQMKDAASVVAEEVKVQIGVEGDKVVCECISNDSKPPVNMERILCTCPKRTENNYELNQKLSCITDTAQQAMEINNSMKQKLEERSPNRTCQLKHAVQLHQKENPNDCARKDNCGAEKMNFDIGSNSSSDENDTWTLIPSTVQYSETQVTRHGSLDFAARYISNTSQASQVVTRYSKIEVQSHTSTTESVIKQNVNMQDIELRLGAKSVSFHTMDKAYDVEVGLGCENRPASRHASALDKISGMLRGLKKKRKSSGYKTHDKDAANNQHELLDSGIELVDMKSKKNMASGKTTSSTEEEFTAGEKEETALDSTFILEGANEAKEELKTNEERAKEEMIAEKSRLAELIDSTKLSHKQRYILILILWSIDADMPEDFFGCLRKSRMFNALLNAQIGMNKELVLENMVSANLENS